MLQNIRDNAQGMMSKIIIGVIAVTFALFGVDSLFTSNGQKSVAEINGEEIAQVDLERAVELAKRQQMQQMGDAYDPALLDESVIRKQMLDQLVERKLILSTAAENGMGVGNQTVDQLIGSMPQFQQEGRFSPEIFQAIARSNGYSAQGFKSVLQEDLLINQYKLATAGSGFIVASDLDTTANIINQKRAFDYFYMPVEKFRDGIVVSDDDVKQYYDNNAEQFMTEEMVKLSYLELKQADFATQDIDAAKVTEVYQQEVADLKATAERRAAHILIADNDSEKVEAALAALKSGKDFSEVAKTFSDDIASSGNGGDLGYTQGDTFPPSFEAALAALSVGEYSPAVVTENGTHIIKLVEMGELDIPSFEDRKAEITKQLQVAAGEADFVKTVEQLKDYVFNSENLTEPAEELGLNINASDWFGRQSASGVFVDPRVQKQIFNDDVLNNGYNSEVVELSKDHYIVVRVEGHKPSVQKEFGIVKDDINKRLGQEKLVAAVKAAAEDLSVKVANAENTMQEVANQQSAKLKVQPLTVRSKALASPELVELVFGMAKPTEKSVAVNAFDLQNGEVVLVALKEVSDGSISELSAQDQTAIKNQLQQLDAQTVMQAYQQAMKQQAQIEINN